MCSFRRKRRWMTNLKISMRANQGPKVMYKLKMEGEDMKHQPNDEYSYVNNTLRAVNARSRKGLIDSITMNKSNQLILMLNKQLFLVHIVARQST